MGKKPTTEVVAMTAPQVSNNINLNLNGLPSGTVTLLSTNNDTVNCKLWDGTTVIASASSAIAVANNQNTITLSGYLASPAANIRISCRDPSSTAGTIQFNKSGNSMDSTISVLRID